MLQSLNHDSWSKKIGIKPQIGTITFLSFSIYCQTLFRVLSAGVLCTLPTTGYARALKFMFIRPELGGKVQDVYFSLHTVTLRSWSTHLTTSHKNEDDLDP